MLRSGAPRRRRRESVLLVRAAEAMPLTQGDVGLVHGLDVGLGCRDDVVTEVPAAHPPPVEKKKKM